MSQEPGHILLIEDDEVQSLLLAKFMGVKGYRVERHATGSAGLGAALEKDFDAVITDLNLPDINGLELLGLIHERKPLLPIIIITGGGTTETAIESTKLGAFDYLTKPVQPDALLAILAKGIHCYRLSTETVGMGRPSSSQRTLIGNSPSMQQLFKEIGRAAAQNVPVLIVGDTGTGKEMVARAIYLHSHRLGKPFVALNCAAIPEQLLESELFGHEKGAFTGAVARRIGRFEQASSGSIFLDEIGELSLSTQAKLLRVLQEQEIQRLGGQENIAVDVRIIAATHRHLEAAIAQRLFREDLFFRLNVVRIRVPTLESRKEDIPDLVAYFIKRYGESLGVPQAGIHPDALQRLMRHRWPGNVRELENMVRKCLLLSQGYQISVDMVEDALDSAPETAAETPQAAPSPVTLDALLRELARTSLRKAEQEGSGNAAALFQERTERLLYEEALAATAGNKTRAAQWLGVSRVTFREKLRRLGLED